MLDWHGMDRKLRVHERLCNTGGCRHIIRQCELLHPTTPLYLESSVDGEHATMGWTPEIAGRAHDQCNLSVARDRAAKQTLTSRYLRLRCSVLMSWHT